MKEEKRPFTEEEVRTTCVVRLLLVQGSRKVLSSYLGQLHFQVGQAMFSVLFPEGQGIGQTIC